MVSTDCSSSRWHLVLFIGRQRPTSGIVTGRRPGIAMHYPTGLAHYPSPAINRHFPGKLCKSQGPKNRRTKILGRQAGLHAWHPRNHHSSVTGSALPPTSSLFPIAEKFLLPFGPFQTPSATSSASYWSVFDGICFVLTCGRYLRALKSRQEALSYIW